MGGFIKIVFLISAIAFLGALYFFLSAKKPGMYPPRNVLKKRARTMALAGGAAFLLGLFMAALQ